MGENQNKTYSDEELKTLGIDLAENKIFSHFHIRESDRGMIGQIFMPIIFGALKDFSDEQKKELGMIYEYFDKAGPSAINGYPIFSSCRLLRQSDTTKVLNYMEEYMKLKTQFLKPDVEQ